MTCSRTEEVGPTVGLQRHRHKVISQGSLTHPSKHRHGANLFTVIPRNPFWSPCTTRMGMRRTCSNLNNPTPPRVPTGGGGGGGIIIIKFQKAFQTLIEICKHYTFHLSVRRVSRGTNIWCLPWWLFKLREKGRDLAQSHWKSPIPSENHKSQVKIQTNATSITPQL